MEGNGPEPTDDLLARLAARVGDLLTGSGPCDGAYGDEGPDTGAEEDGR
jgi:hypothetical protein